MKVKVYLEVNKAKTIWTGRVNLELTVDGPQKITIAKYEQLPTNDKGTLELDLNMTISQVFFIFFIDLFVHVTFIFLQSPHFDLDVIKTSNS